MDLTLAAVVFLVVAVLAALGWAFRSGGAVERAKAGRDRAEEKAATAVEHMQMQAEAARIEHEVDGLSETELEEELIRWARSSR